jgi:hypothetical protein
LRNDGDSPSREKGLESRNSVVGGKHRLHVLNNRDIFSLIFTVREAIRSFVFEKDYLLLLQTM